MCDARCQVSAWGAGPAGLWLLISSSAHIGRYGVLMSVLLISRNGHFIFMNVSFITGEGGFFSRVCFPNYV